MLEIGRDHPSYLPSSILSKKIKKYHDQQATLAPYLSSLKDQQGVQKLSEVNSEQTFNNAFKQICSFVEPTVIHLRLGGGDNERKATFMNML